MDDGSPMDSNWVSIDSSEGNVDEDPMLPVTSILENPVFVRWCAACGLEAKPTDSRCERCGGRIERHQRVLELSDEDDGPFSLRSLRDALADVCIGDVNSSALLLSQRGPDPGVAAAYPVLACELSSLGVPPVVQRALVCHGFTSLEKIIAAVAAAPDANTLACRLGLSPAAEVLLRRFWHVAVEAMQETSSCRKQHSDRKLRLDSWSSDVDAMAGDETPCEEARVKRVRASERLNLGFDIQSAAANQRMQDMELSGWEPSFAQPAIEDGGQRTFVLGFSTPKT